MWTQRKPDSLNTAQPWKLWATLAILQGEGAFLIFYGALLLPRDVLEAKTLAIKHVPSQMTPGLPGTIVEAIKSLFAKTLDSKDVLLAAVTLPKFRLSQVREEIRKQPIKLLLTTENHSLTEEPAAQMHGAQPAAAVCGCPPPLWWTAHRLQCVYIHWNRYQGLS